MTDQTEMNYGMHLQKQKERQAAEEASENITQFYNNWKEICDRAYMYYKEFEENVNDFIDKPIVKSKEDFVRLLSDTIVLVITANPIEEAVFLRWLNHTTGSILESYIIGSTAMVIGRIDEKTIIHIHPKRTGEEYTRVILNEVTKVFKPTYIFMLGICYGLDMKRYKVGSVFASDSIITFRLNFRDEIGTNRTIYQAEDEYERSPDENLVNRIHFKLRYSDIYSILSDKNHPVIAKTRVGRFLSSNSLMSSKRVKTAIMEQYSVRKPEPLGGEMEGAGILKSYYVQEDGFKKWMIVKSICDWGEKKNALSPDKDTNSRIKDSIQAFAMTNTCGAFEEIITILE